MTSQQQLKRKVLLEGWRRFFVSSFDVRQLLAKPNKNGTNIEHKCDRSGPGGGARGTQGQGVLENQRKYETIKKEMLK